MMERHQTKIKVVFLSTCKDCLGEQKKNSVERGALFCKRSVNPIASGVVQKIAVNYAFRTIMVCVRKKPVVNK